MRRGRTLVETLVALAVGALLLTVLYTLFVHGTKLFARGVSRTDMQAAGLTTLGHMMGELRRSGWSTLTIQGNALACRPADPEVEPPPDYEPVFGFVVYYLDSARHALIRKTWTNDDTDPVHLDPDPIAAGDRLGSADLGRLATTQNGTETTVAQNVTMLGFNPPQYPDLTHVQPTITVSMTVAAAAEQQTILSSVVLRNR